MRLAISVRNRGSKRGKSKGDEGVMKKGGGKQSQLKVE